VETVSPVKGVSFTVWDIGGQKKIRDLWRYYYQSTDGLIFVVDSTDSDRLSEACEELFSMLNDDAMTNVPVVVIANKQDLPTAIKVDQLVTRLNLNNLPKTHKWFIQGACAINGDGIWESIRQLADMIKDQK
jgi:ADP-ribosylation factor protein 1